MITPGINFWFVGGLFLRGSEWKGREGREGWKKKRLHEGENVTEAPESLTMTTVELDWI
jgi:hypothetical protein